MFPLMAGEEFRHFSQTRSRQVKIKNRLGDQTWDLKQVIPSPQALISSSGNRDDHTHLSSVGGTDSQETRMARGSSGIPHFSHLPSRHMLTAQVPREEWVGHEGSVGCQF